jgi:hypothetical protein
MDCCWTLSSWIYSIGGSHPGFHSGVGSQACIISPENQSSCSLSGQTVQWGGLMPYFLLCESYYSHICPVSSTSQASQLLQLCDFHWLQNHRVDTWIYQKLERVRIWWGICSHGVRACWNWKWQWHCLGPLISWVCDLIPLSLLGPLASAAYREGLDSQLATLSCAVFFWGYFIPACSPPTYTPVCLWSLCGKGIAVWSPKSLLFL